MTTRVARRLLAVALAMALVPATAGASVFSEFSTPTSDSQPFGITAGPGRGDVVHRVRRQQGRAHHDRSPRWRVLDSHRRKRVLHRRRPRRRALVHRGAAERSGASPPPAASPSSSSAAAQRAVWDHVGPDGALWFTELNGNKIGRIIHDATPAPESPSSRSRPPSAGPWHHRGPRRRAVVHRANGRRQDRADHNRRRGHRVPGPDRRDVPVGIAAGPDGALWFTEDGGDRIGRITTAGAITEYPTPAGSGPYDIAAGSDGALWFTENGPAANRIGRIDPAAANAGTSNGFTEYSIPTTSSGPVGIAAGGDGALWFTELNASRIGRITIPDPGNQGPAGPPGATGPTGSRERRERRERRVFRVRRERRGPRASRRR